MGLGHGFWVPMVSIFFFLRNRRSNTDNLRLSREVILQARSRNSGMVDDSHVLHIHSNLQWSLHDRLVNYTLEDHIRILPDLKRYPG